MDAQESFDNDVLAVLHVIEKERLYLPIGEPILFTLRGYLEAKGLGLPDIKHQRQILDMLEQEGAFKIEVVQVDNPFARMPELFERADTKDDAYLLKLSDDFGAIYDKYLKKHQSRVALPVHNDESTVEVYIRKEGQSLFLTTPNEKLLIKTMRYGLMPDTFWDYLLSHHSERVTRQQLKRDVDGLASLDDISEVVRQSGFGKDMKHIFFAEIGKDIVRLKNPAILTAAQLSKLTYDNRTKS